MAHAPADPLAAGRACGGSVAFNGAQIFVAYRGAPSGPKQWAPGGRHVLVAQAELAADIASRVWEAAGRPVIGHRREITSEEDRRLLMHGGRAVRAAIAVAVCADLCRELGREDLPEWAQAELQRRLDADARMQALADFVALWEVSLADPTLNVWWTEE